MVDPTSDLCENVAEADAPRCTACAEPIVADPGHRVVTEVVDSRVETTHFCGGCLSAGN